MSWHANQLKYAFGLGGMMSFYGIVGLIVWMLPPGLVSNQYKIVVIALVLLTLPFSLLFMFVASRREKKKARLEAEAAQQAAETNTPAAAQPAPAPVGNFANITSSAEETVQFLKSSNLGTSGRDAVYSLPWYLVAGAPRAGKSSLVLSSNLNFQTLPSQRQSEQKFVRPTGSIDWRVTSDAVFVDTAGRYQTEGIDSEEWASLLETMKKYRGNRPVDGFLLVVSAETILKSDERQMEELAKVLRARLDETTQRLKVRFPVYVVFTHADAIEGFRDSFSSSKNEDKTLVWGATIPIEKSENAQALFDSEYEILHNSLMKRRIVRLSAPFPAVRQLRIFNFPLHFGSARRKFGSFINALFRPNPFSENPFLRGFYFTASPIGKSNGSAAVVGSPYFTERFFRDVVLRDKDLVKTYLDSRQRAPIMGWMSTILGGLLVFAFLVMSGVSLVNNRLLLKEAESRGENLLQMVKQDIGKNPLDKKPEAVRDEVARIENMRQYLARLDEYDREGPPWYMGFGLYSGTRVFKENLLPNYLTVVEQRFKAPAVQKLEADLEKFAKSKPVANPSKLTEEEEKLLEEHLNMLKAYLMLSGEYKEQAQPAHVASVLKKYWVSESKVPDDLRGVSEQQLEFWARQIHRPDVSFPRIQPKEGIVAGARSKLKDFPAPYRYLSRKVTEVSKQIDDSVGLMTVDGLLSRAVSDSSRFTSNYSVQGAYSRDGYELMKEAIQNAETEMKKDDWVMGPGFSETSGGIGISQIEDKYLRDYAIHWTNLVRATSVKPYRNRDEAVSAIQTFAQVDSPMRILSREIAKHTNLSEELDTDGWWPWLKSFFVKRPTTTARNTEPEKQFGPLFDFVGKTNEKSQFDTYAATMNRLFIELNRKAPNDGALKKLGEELTGSEKDALDLAKREGEVSTLVTQLNTPAGQEIARLMQEPFVRLRTLMGAGGKELLIKTWNKQVLPEAKAIEKGYPFDQSATDADMKVLSTFLAPGEGTLSRFYDEKLKNYFELANGQYRVREGSELQFNDEFVAYLNNAFALREALFGKNATPKFEYDFVLKPTTGALVEITIDGQKASTGGTGSIKGTFPGSGSSETGVLMKLASSSETTASSAPPSANTSDSNVSTVSGSPSTGSPGERTFPGQWGLFKFVDDGSPAKQESGEYLLKYTLGGKPVTATIKASGGDLFDKQIFRRVRAPQNFLK